MSKSIRDHTTDERAARVAAAAGTAEVLAATSPTALAALLDRAADELAAEGEQLVAVADAESGLGPIRLESELARTVGQFRAFAGYVRSGEELDAVIEHLPTGAPAADLRRSNHPVGLVAVYGASNFPLAFGVPGGDTAAAWAARCPVVAKVHPAQPRTSELAARCLRDAARAEGLPPSILEVVHGAAPEASIGLVGDPLVAAVAFTGSTAAGLALCAAAAARPRPIPVHAEMGSVNPVVLGATTVSGERLPATARLLAASMTQGWGQFCTKPGVVLTPPGSAAAVFDALARELAGTEPATMLTEGIARSFDAGVARSVAVGSVRRWTGDRARGVRPASPATVAVTDVETFLRETTLQREHFGPFGLVVELDSPADIARVLRAVGGSLTGTALGDPDDPWVREAIAVLPRHVGRVLAAGMPTGVAVSRAQVHGGPFPASSTAHTSVGLAAVARFQRPVAYQDVPDVLRPPPLQDANPWGIARTVDGLFVPASLHEQGVQR